MKGKKMKNVTTTFYLNGRIKTFNSESEAKNLEKFLDEFSEATPELFEDKNKIITSIRRENNVSQNFRYTTRDEINNFLSCKFKSTTN